MKNVHSCVIIAALALSFTFLSFSDKEQDLYGASFTYQQAGMGYIDQPGGVAFTPAVVPAVRVIAPVAVRYLTPQVAELTRNASTPQQLFYADNLDRHTSKYFGNIEKHKAQKIHALG